MNNVANVLPVSPVILVPWAIVEKLLIFAALVVLLGFAIVNYFCTDKGRVKHNQKKDHHLEGKVTFEKLSENQKTFLHERLCDAINVPLRHNKNDFHDALEG